MAPTKPDYSLYLVTDSTTAIIGNRDIVEVVEAALRGGVTLVQYREKKSDTGHMIAVAKRLHEVTRRYKVPLLINDRVDVALAVGCEGVHVGQDDMALDLARKLLGPDKIIGVTTSNVAEALAACQCGADYLGIGTVFATSTKTNTKNIIGTTGVRMILDAIWDHGHHSVATVDIGGINESNIQRVNFQTGNPSKKSLDGHAIVSAIMAAEDPEAASRTLLTLLRTPPPFVQEKTAVDAGDARGLVISAASIVKQVSEVNPLSHNMTNLVVQNFAANVALAVGASPIMSNYGEEAGDLSKLAGALVINMGTVTPEGLENYLKALKAYNSAGRPVVYDPVGAGATAIRRAAAKTILAGGYVDVIKGNEGEIRALYGLYQSQDGVDAPQQHGVDSSSTLNLQQKIELTRSLARLLRTVVVTTGKTDVISNGMSGTGRTVLISNGHEMLGSVTGTGCSLGTVISAALAARPADKLAAVVAAILHFEIAAEVAVTSPDVHGPGTFVPAFLDELYAIRVATAKGDSAWLQKAKVEVVPT